MSVRPIARSFLTTRKFPISLKLNSQCSQLAQRRHQSPPARHASSSSSSSAPNNVYLTAEKDEDLVNSQAPYARSAVIKKALASSNTPDLPGWTLVYLIKFAVSRNVVPLEHSNLRWLANKVIKSKEPLLECAMRLVIVRSALCVPGAHISKLVSESITRLNELAKDHGPDGLGDYFFQILAVGARYGYVMRKGPEDYAIYRDRFDYVHDRLNQWKDEEDPFVEIVSKADFLVWYSELLGQFTNDDAYVQQTKRMLETAAYDYNHANAHEMLLQYYDPTSLEYHDCLCTVASEASENGARAAMKLGDMYSLPIVEFRKLDKELQEDIGTPAKYSMRDMMPRLRPSDPEALRLEWLQFLRLITREYSKLGVAPSASQYTVPINVPGRIFKALYWYFVASLQLQEATSSAMRLSQEYNLVADGLWSQSMRFTLWSRTDKYFGLEYRGAQRTTVDTIFEPFRIALAWLHVKRPLD